jgi:sodium-dependent dicarboxylate transporter 2/3/5
MWISNTATAMMMWPIAMSIIALLEKESGKPATILSKSLMLAVAYASSIGGIGTLIGTPPNTVMRGIVHQMTGYEIGFMDWMLLAMPLVLLMLAILYLLLTKVCLRPEPLEGDVAKVVDTEIQRLGPITTAEKRVMVIFVLTALCWMFRTLLNEVLPLQLDDTGIAIMAGVALFLIPSGIEKKQALLQWDDAQKVSWGIILLFGGGLSLAKGMEVSGLVGLLGEAMAAGSGGHIGWLVVLFIILGIFLTEVMSNVALVNVLLPVVIALGLNLKTDVLQFAIPLTIASSCAFMLPMATPPNAVVFASGKLQIKDMVRVGLWLNIVAIACILALWWILGPLLFPEITEP